MYEADSDTIELIQRAKSLDQDAMNALAGVIIKQYADPALRRWRGRNVLVDNDELRQEFLIGCICALDNVRIDVGNPIRYLIQKGVWAALEYIRKQMGNGVRMHCIRCGRIGRIHTDRGMWKCPKCGSLNVETFMREEHVDITLETCQIDDKQMMRDIVYDQVEERLLTEEVERRLNGRTLELYKLIVYEGMEKGTSKNYLADLARRMGGISTACVSIYLKKIRAVVMEVINPIS